MKALPLIWAIAWNRSAGDEIISQLLNHEGLTKNAEITYTSLSEAGIVDASLISRSSNLVAVLLVVEHEAVTQKLYRQWLQWCLDRIVQRADFRLFICLPKMSISNLRQMASKPDDLIANLLDTVQITENSGLQDQIFELADYVKNLPQIREALAYQRWRVGITATTGILASWVQYLATVLVLLGGILVLKHYVQAGEWPVLAKCGIAVASGIIYAELTIISAFFLSRLDTWHYLMRERSLQIQWLFVAFFGPWSVGLPSRIGAPASWVILGIVAGIILDYARRSGLQAKKFRKKINPENITPLGSRLSPALSKLAAGCPPNALKCHLFGQQIPHVFISYTRSSEWACQQAIEINRILTNAKADCFLDRNVLLNGSNWRKQLNDHLVASNVFISLVDKDSIKRRWPSAELEMAMECRRINALPDIILLVAQGTSVNGETLPIFDGILSVPRLGLTENRPRVLELGTQTTQMLTEALKSTRYLSTGALPLSILYFLKIVLMPIIFALNAAGACGAIIGAFAGLLVLSNWYFHLNLAGSIPTAANSALAITAAYLMAFTGRLAFASKFEVKFNDLPALVAFNLIGVGGFILIFTAIYENLGPLVWGWVLVTISCGWIMGADLLHFSNIGDPNRFRRTPT